MSDCRFIQLNNGPRLAYLEQGPRDGPAVIMLPGYSDSCRSFDLLRPLLPRSWRAIAVSPRGHGLSDKPDDGYSIPEFAGDIAAFMDAMAIERAVLVGHSMSTGVVLQVAADYPDRVAGVALLGAFADFSGNPGVGELAQAVAALDEPIDPAFVREFQESTLANPIAAEFLERAISESLQLPAHVWKSCVTGMLACDPCALAARCQAPAAIIWGDRDAFCPHADQLKLRDRLCSSRLFTLANAGHAIHWERPADVAALLRAFIAEIEDAAAASSDFAAA